MSIVLLPPCSRKAATGEADAILVNVASSCGWSSFGMALRRRGSKHGRALSVTTVLLVTLAVVSRPPGGTSMRYRHIVYRDATGSRKLRHGRLAVAGVADPWFHAW